MPSPELENLVKIDSLKREAGSRDEFDGLMASARARLTDSQNEALALESRFDLAYNASHSIALAALRWHGYRSSNRYIVLQALPHTLGLKPSVWRVMGAAHTIRNSGEYEGLLEINIQLVTDLIAAAEAAYSAAKALGPLTPEPRTSSGRTINKKPRG